MPDRPPAPPAPPPPRPAEGDAGPSLVLPGALLLWLFVVAATAACWGFGSEMGTALGERLFIPDVPVLRLPALRPL
jgi:hypothetical protein